MRPRPTRAGTRARTPRERAPCWRSAPRSRQRGTRAPGAERPAAVEETLTGVDALAGPPVGYCAPEQDPPFGVGDDNAEGRFTGPYNLTGHPAVSIPVPAPGLPVGLQLAGRRDGDLALLELAAAAQRLLSAPTAA